MRIEDNGFGQGKQHTVLSLRFQTRPSPGEKRSGPCPDISRW